MAQQEDGSLKLVHEGYNTVAAVPYDVPIVGYHNNVVNTLRLWNAEVPQDFASLSGTREQLQERLRQSYRVQAITSCLYPEDSSYEGKMLRLTQEYFFVSAGVQSIVRHYKRRKGDLKDFAKKLLFISMILIQQWQFLNLCVYSLTKKVWIGILLGISLKIQ